MTINSYFKLPYLYKKIGKDYFLSSYVGSWIILTEEELNLFKSYPLFSNIFPKELLERLKNTLFLVSEDNKKEELSQIIQQKYFMDIQGPSLFMIGVTRQCNLSCLYCHLSSKKIKKVKRDKNELIDKTLEFIFSTPSGAVTIEFQGGEPLLEIDFIEEFTKRAKEKNKQCKKNIRFSLTSNLTLLNEKILNRLIKAEICMSTTLDGDKITHNLNRPFNKKLGSYDAVINHIELLKKHNMNFGILSIITKKSLNKEKEIIDQIFTMSSNKILSFNKIQKLGRASKEKNWKDYGLTNEEFFNFWKNSIEYIFSLQKNDVLISERSLGLVLDKLFNDSADFVNWRNPGGNVISAIGFDDDGYIYPSDESREILDLRIGNVYKDSYEDVLGHKISKEMIKASILEGQFCNYCVYKSFCGLCPDIAYKNTKEFMTRHYESYSRCKLNEMIFDYVIQKINEDPETIAKAMYTHKILQKNRG
ncbi:MAG: radical SAM protein [Chlamydiae bacterium]|nr:radical SAM protein [Chlamydiota bacterium]